MRKTKHRGPARVAGDFLLNLNAYNLVSIPKLIAVWVGRQPIVSLFANRHHIRFAIVDGLHDKTRAFRR